MKKFLAGAVLAFGALILISCGETNVAPKKTDAAMSNSATNNAPATTTSANADADVKKLLDDLAAAVSKNDVAALEKIYADDYTVVTATGDVQTKAQRLEAMKAGDLKFSGVAFTDVKVRTYGDTAVAIATSTGTTTMKGAAADASYRVTFVANKGKDGWRLSSASLVPRADAAKKDEKTKTDDAKLDDAKVEKK